MESTQNGPWNESLENGDIRQIEDRIMYMV